jgi:hypothetical protein
LVVCRHPGFEHLNATRRASRSFVATLNSSRIAGLLLLWSAELRLCWSV